MNGQPVTPPRRNPLASSHLHKRSVSRTPSSLGFSPPASNSNRSSPTRYQLMGSDSPKHPRRRLADSVAGASDWVGANHGVLRGGKESNRARNLVVLLVVTMGLLVLGARSWDRETGIMSGVRKVDALTGLSAVKPLVSDSVIEVKGNDSGNDGQQRNRVVQEVGKDRWVKISKPSRLDSSQRPAAGSSSSVAATTSELDASRKFIFVGWMGEQETKAQAHLYQLGLLALATNRTLVLPGVRRSRFGSCYRSNDFSLYYASDTLDRFNIPYVTDSDFSTWVDQREEIPTARMVSFARGSPVPLGNLDATPKHFCLDTARLDWTRQEQTAFFIPSTDWKSPEVRAEFGETVVKQLVDEGSDVIVVQYNLRFPFLTPQSISTLSPYSFPPPRPYSYFPYSSHWINLGQAIADQISPFVGVHWRTETLAVDRIASCGVALVRELRKIRKENPAINTLYLATDYPLDFLRGNDPGGGGGARHRRRPRGASHPPAVVANSGTMSKTLTPGHHEAMKSFLSLLEGETEDDEFHLTTFSEESRLARLDPALERMLSQGGGFENLDGAISGLVDKIVLSNAELFYAGLPVSDDKETGCAKLSQFTTQIIHGRKESLSKSASEDEETRLWNDVGHFSL